VFCASESGNSSADGTSFASPLMAGFAACMWQKNRSMKAMEVFKAIEKAGHLYPYFDYAHGYGIPHAERFNKQVEGPEYFKFERNVTGSEISIMLNDSIAETDSPQLLYYELVRSDGLLESYYTMQVIEQIPLRIETAMMGNTKLRVHYRGQTAEIQINP
jgi:serine protease AprX